MRGVPRNGLRIPIAAAMAIVALLAVEMASLRVASDGYVDLTRHLTVVMLAVATYLARYREGDRAAWWFGFALLGWAYFALVIDASARRAPVSLRRPFVSPPMNVPLPPMTLLGLFFSDEVLNGPSEPLIKLWWNQYEIVQSMLNLFVAGLGGLVCWIRNRRRGAPYHAAEPRSGKLDLNDRTE